MGSFASRLNMRVAVLGASGQIGSVVVNHLAQVFPNAEVVACVRKVPAQVAQNGIHYLRFQPFTDAWSILGKVDVLINSIGIIEETPDLDFERAHRGLTQLMLQHRLTLGDPKLIQISVLGADTQSHSLFLQTKALADRELLLHPRTVVLRPAIVCTPGTVMVQKLRMLGRISRYLGGYLPFPSGFAQTRIQPVMAGDLAQLTAVLCITDEHPSLIPVAGPQAYSLKEMVNFLGNGRIHLIPFSQRLFQIFFPLASALFPRLLNQGQFQLLERDNVADPSIFQLLLGCAPADTEPFWQRELGNY
jgi:uncharacterized protein YbjT (DUF2867 family)